jgi:hypothetical protein
MTTQDWSWQRYADDPVRYRMDEGSFHRGPEPQAQDLVAHENASYSERFEPEYLDWRARQMEPHDSAYRRWRALEVARHDELYRAWRDQRRNGFHTAFDTWRTSRPGAGDDLPLDAADVKIEPAGAANLSGVAPIDRGSPQINDIADGGAGHARIKQETQTGG